ncbi:MAG: hypothetical protein II865_10120 [Bacteroidales bacterium]|jgi:hypothetical protein|nr:hypothetical protein [Bacteroidales bacterium]
MKKIALLAIVCCAMVFSSCNRDQHTYYTSVSYSQAENTESVISIKAVLGTINLFWNGDYTFTGNDEGYTDLKAQTKFVESKLAILAHGNEIKTHMAADDYFYYRMYRKDGNVLLEATKFYLDANGNLTSTDEVDNVED